MEFMPVPTRPVIAGIPDASADPDHVRAAMGRFPSGVAALCAVVDGRPVGMSVSSFTVGVSYSPPMVMFSSQNTSSTWPLLARSERIGVSVLGAGQSAVCMQLASRKLDRFDGLETIETEKGALLIDGAAMWLDCEVVSSTPVGDHHIVVLLVHGIEARTDHAPLVYHQRGFHSLSAIA